MIKTLNRRMCNYYKPKDQARDREKILNILREENYEEENVI